MCANSLHFCVTSTNCVSGSSGSYFIILALTFSKMSFIYTIQITLGFNLLGQKLPSKCQISPVLFTLRVMSLAIEWSYLWSSLQFSLSLSPTLFCPFPLTKFSSYFAWPTNEHKVNSYLATCSLISSKIPCPNFLPSLSLCWRGCVLGTRTSTFLSRYYFHFTLLFLIPISISNCTSRTGKVNRTKKKSWTNWFTR